MTLESLEAELTTGFHPGDALVIGEEERVVRYYITTSILIRIHNVLRLL